MKAVTLISANSQVQNNKVIEKWDSQLPWQLNNPSPCHWNLRGMPTPPRKSGIFSGVMKPTSLSLKITTIEIETSRSSWNDFFFLQNSEVSTVVSEKRPKLELIWLDYHLRPSRARNSPKGSTKDPLRKMAFLFYMSAIWKSTVSIYGYCEYIRRISFSFDRERHLHTY